MNLTLFLLLALTASWTGLVRCEDNEETEEALQLPTILTQETESEEKNAENQGDGAGSGDERAAEFDFQPNDESNTDRTVSNEETNPTAEANTEAETDDLDTVMIIIPVVLTLVLMAVIMCIVIVYRRWRIKAENTKEDPYLDHEDHEKVPMPMFEDDIPSVMELEMEDLENWVTKDGGKKVDTGQI